MKCQPKRQLRGGDKGMVLVNTRMVQVNTGMVLLIRGWCRLIRGWCWLIRGWCWLTLAEGGQFSYLVNSCWDFPGLVTPG